MTYEAFKAQLASSDCKKCILSQTRTQIVVDRGSPSADILIIGEAPGEKEDLSGQAFVGRAGKLLDLMFLNVGIDTNRDCLILNIVKCRPPKNRRPKPEEALACKPHLLKQLSFLVPKIVVLLGATAFEHMRVLDSKPKMSDVVGKLLDHPMFPEAKLIVLFHPAYILRDPRKKPIMANHIQIIRDFLKIQ